MKTQGRRLIEACKRKPRTYMELLSMGISVCPWKRIRESLACNEVIVKGKRGELVTWAVKRA
jgi:hypothetical protein